MGTECVHHLFRVVGCTGDFGMRLKIIRGLWYICDRATGDIVGGGYREMGDCVVWLNRTHKNFSIDHMGNVNLL